MEGDKDVPRHQNYLFFSETASTQGASIDMEL